MLAPLNKMPSVPGNGLNNGIAELAAMELVVMPEPPSGNHNIITTYL